MKCYLSWSILKQFSGRNMLGFTIQDVISEFPERNPVHLARILAKMVQKGMLCRIARNIYHIIPIDQDPLGYFPDWCQVVKYTMLHKEYYIGYGSALKLHGLAPRTSMNESELTEYVVTKQQIKQANRNLAGTRYQYVHHCADRYFGCNMLWINQFEQVMVSDLEKTIVDISTKPHFCGGIVEVGNAIFQSIARIDQDKLFYYFARNMNKSAKKRFLFFIDLLDLPWTSEHETMREELGSWISLLDPTEPCQGKRKFGLKVNVDPIQLRNIILHQKML